ncbi:MAG: hypothetical protein LZF62_360195 [Nitrospira sp.]|nr:MAG: hypothetical protein LZF62_360195 [Nitrospira sp.]
MCRMRGCRGRFSFAANGSFSMMLKRATSGVLSHPAPCDVPQGYASVVGLPAALLDGPFEHHPPIGWKTI